jgi:hypothetical protein
MSTEKKRLPKTTSFLRELRPSIRKRVVDGNPWFSFHELIFLAISRTSSNSLLLNHLEHGLWLVPIGICMALFCMLFKFTLFNRQYTIILLTVLHPIQLHFLSIGFQYYKSLNSGLWSLSHLYACMRTFLTPSGKYSHQGKRLLVSPSLVC